MHRSITAAPLAGIVAASSIWLGVLLPGTVASATTATPVKEVCKTVVGNEIQLQFTSCAGSKTDGTSATGTAKGSTELEITFNTGRTAIENYKYRTLSPNVCPSTFGFVRHAEYAESGSILPGGTATDLIGSKVSATLCVYIAQIGSRILIKNLHGTVAHL